MIADRHIFIIGQQRAVGPELAADIGGVMDADIEIGIVADRRGQMERAVCDAACSDGSTAARLRRVGQQLRQPPPQRRRDRLSAAPSRR
jgi:hypothetical protein